METGQSLNISAVASKQILRTSTYESNRYLKNSKVIDFFQYLYSYPPKFTIKWNSLDELTQDLLLDNKYNVIAHSFPFIDFVEDLFFQDLPQKGTAKKPSLKEFSEGYLNKIFSSNFYENKTKLIQTALAPIPVFIILNDAKEIVLSKPINFARAQAAGQPIKNTIYNSCGNFDTSIDNHSKLGFFFFSKSDAEIYLNEVAKSDLDDTRLFGLSISCIGLDAAYRITREHHPNVDFRFVPNYKEVKELLASKIEQAKFVVDDGQQQLRFRARTTNFFSSFGKFGKLLLPNRSFLQRNEYFKGTPIYIVQLHKESRNLLLETYFQAVGQADSMWGGLIQFYDRAIGFGHNWIMQGSLKNVKLSGNEVNYVFFDEKSATEFVNKQGRKIRRYRGSRSSNIEFMVRKPKIFVSNLEDFLESWEEKILADIKNQKTATIFDAKNTFFVPSKDSLNTILNLSENDTGNVQNFSKAIGLKYRLLKNYIGFIFSVGYA